MNYTKLIKISKNDTKLDYDLFLYTSKVKKSAIMPIVYVCVNGEFIPMYISKNNADIKCTYKRIGINTFDNIDQVRKYLIKNFNTLLNHWNSTITDIEVKRYLL